MGSRFSNINTEVESTPKGYCLESEIFGRALEIGHLKRSGDNRQEDDDYQNCKA